MTARTHHHLLTIGPALRGPGYPNASNTIELLQQTGSILINDKACWLPEDFHLWKLAHGTGQEKRRGLWLLSRACVLSVLRLIRHHRSGQPVYLPYPSLPLLWLLSWLPTTRRPSCIVDAYITLWDTLYQDRQLGQPTGLASRLLLRAERRALGVAQQIIVDTQANADHLAGLFHVPRQRIRALPLALDPATLPQRTPPASQVGLPTPTRIVFIGTFVPLQGTQVIAQAIALLGQRDDLQFTLIGDGQQASQAAPLLQGLGTVTWLRGWQAPATLAQALDQADICLGVFGGNDKAARVLPFKLYMALAAGKAIITQQHYSLPDDCPPLPALTCAAQPQALAAAIAQLAAAPAQRQQLGQQAAAYFQQYLSPTQLFQRWQALLAYSTAD